MSPAFYIQAEALAGEERRRLGLGDDPVIDARALVEQQGVLVYVTPIPGGSLSGCFVVVAGEPWMMVNSAHPLGRQRFTIAHEYCHSLVHRDLGFVVCGREKPPHEKLADAFAAAFLMPAVGAATFFAADLGRPKVDAQKVVDFCYAYGVSYRAAVYRLHNLRIITAPHRDALLEEAPSRVAASMGYDLQDPTCPFYATNPDTGRAFDSLPRGYRSLAISAFEDERISESKLAELLGVDVDDLDNILDPVEVDDVLVG
ncbi:MAG: ImmA/IrrE family metallo-endopeptidase [Actinomycetota bacterium]|nr:ImmA/IrrE family metallo-endopeptidase [Actinomycetota bacterium]